MYNSMTFERKNQHVQPKPVGSERPQHMSLNGKNFVYSVSPNLFYLTLLCRFSKTLPLINSFFFFVIYCKMFGFTSTCSQTKHVTGFGLFVCEEPKMVLLVTTTIFINLICICNQLSANISIIIILIKTRQRCQVLKVTLIL